MEGNYCIPAFLLLLLADTPCYGALLLTRLQTELPYCFCDSAIVYRSLQEMEKNGSMSMPTMFFRQNILTSFPVLNSIAILRTVINQILFKYLVCWH